eukprot:6989959-Prymnesium_polylepis.1
MGRRQERLPRMGLPCRRCRVHSARPRVRRQAAALAAQAWHRHGSRIGREGRGARRRSVIAAAPLRAVGCERARLRGGEAPH